MFFHLSRMYKVMKSNLTLRLPNLPCLAPSNVFGLSNFSVPTSYSDQRMFSFNKNE